MAPEARDLVFTSAINKGAALVYTSNVDSNVSRHGLTLPQGLREPRLVNVKHSDYKGGRLLGKELCRLTEAIPRRQQVTCLIQQKSGRGLGDSYASERICDGVTSKVKEFCGHKDHQFTANIVYPSMPAGLDIQDTESPELQEWRTSVKDRVGSALIADTYISVIVTPEDFLAELAWEAVARYRPAYDQVLISGFGHTSLGKEHLLAGHMFGTIDTQYYKKGRGLQFTLSRIIPVVGRELNGLPSEISKELLPGEDSGRIYSDTELYVADMQGKMVQRLFRTYDGLVPPSGSDIDGCKEWTGSERDAPDECKLRVRAKLYDIHIADTVIVEGKLEVSYWLKLNWLDRRLAWDPEVYDGLITIDYTKVWRPPYYWQNKARSQHSPPVPSPLTSYPAAPFPHSTTGGT